MEASCQRAGLAKSTRSVSHLARSSPGRLRLRSAAARRPEVARDALHFIACFPSWKVTKGEMCLVGSVSPGAQRGLAQDTGPALAERKHANMPAVRSLQLLFPSPEKAPGAVADDSCLRRGPVRCSINRAWRRPLSSHLSLPFSSTSFQVSD